MTTRWLFAAAHLLALGIGLGAIWSRARAFQGPLDATGLRRAFYADSWWGIAALLWIATGLTRAFAGLEKGSAYYLHNHVFWAKMVLLGIILVLDIVPMLTLIRWRMLVSRGENPDTSAASRLATISYVEAGLLILMILAATAMARGYGAATGGQAT